LKLGEEDTNLSIVFMTTGLDDELEIDPHIKKKSFVSPWKATTQGYMRLQNKTATRHATAAGRTTDSKASDHPA
jgi:hypothetical protein